MNNLHFKIIIPCYNVEKWIKNTLISVLEQEYQNYQCIIIDDLSSDGTQNIIEQLIKNNNNFIFIKNKTKKYALKNIVEGIKISNPLDEDIIVTLDGDDWFSNKKVLNTLKNVYEENQCLLTYGSYCEIPGYKIGAEASEYSEEVKKNNLYRQDRWRASHLRTFKYKLWKNIKDEDLRDTDGNYYRMTWDQAFMLPMLEMSGGKIEYIKDILYCYNRENPINDDKINSFLQQKTQWIIRNKEKYGVLTNEN